MTEQRRRREETTVAKMNPTHPRLGEIRLRATALDELIGLPEGAEVQRVYVDMERYELVVVVADPRLEPVPPGAQPPTVAILHGDPNGGYESLHPRYDLEQTPAEIWEETREYGYLTEHGWIVEPRGKHYSMHWRTVRKGPAYWSDGLEEPTLVYEPLTVSTTAGVQQAMDPEVTLGDPANPLDLIRAVSPIGGQQLVDELAAPEACPGCKSTSHAIRLTEDTTGYACRNLWHLQ